MTDVSAFHRVYYREIMAECSMLSALEFGAYMALRAAYWSNGCKGLSVQDSRLAIAAKCTPDEWAAVSGAVMEFFRLDGDVFRHDRLDADKVEAVEAHESAVARGKAGAEARAAKLAAQAQLKLSSSSATSSAKAGPAKAKVKQPLTTTTTTTNNTTPISPSAAKEPDGFAEWWEAFGKVGSRKDAAEAYVSALKRTAVNPSTLLASAKAYHSMILKRPKSEHRFHKHGQGWLNGDMWEGQVIPPEPKVIPGQYNPFPHIPVPEVQW